MPQLPRLAPALGLTPNQAHCEGCLPARALRSPAKARECGGSGGETLPPFLDLDRSEAEASQETGTAHRHPLPYFALNTTPSLLRPLFYFRSPSWREPDLSSLTINRSSVLLFFVRNLRFSLLSASR